MNIQRQTLNLHKKVGGKLGIYSRIQLKTRRDLALAYTPGVAEISKRLFHNPSFAHQLTIKKNCIAVVTDGSAILGLGNLGPLAALPVMEGKCILFKKLAGVDAFPLCLNTQEPVEIVSIIKNIAPVFGGINLEDIAAPRCFEIENRLRRELNIPVLHDDQHGTAVVVLAALINALKLKGLTKTQAQIVICGAGAAGTAVTKLLLKFGIKHILVCDREGILAPAGRLPRHKAELARLTNPNRIRGNLKDALKGADVFIGLSAKNLLKSAMIKLMNPQPIIFALANPYPEIHPRKAQKAGAFIVATGRSDFPNQLNNLLAFPGIFRGALDNRVRKITDKMLLRAAQNLSQCVKKPSPAHLLPDPLDRRAVKAVAKAIKH